ncbi:MAG: SMC-Scp complex subunit ScpB [Verrucomicrobiae bacterium]|nr:SMC-Scp complex subunit ScpB [Verrucomicrobiae bacterium]
MDTPPTLELATVVEALIFAAQDGIRTNEIVKAIQSAIAGAQKEESENASEAEYMASIGDVTEETVTQAIQTLSDRYEEQGHAFVLLERADGWRVFTNPSFSVWVRELFPGKKPSRLSPPALETLAIIAYRQPITKAGVEAVRGVSVDGVLQTLLDRNILRIAGRADLPGRPLLYETTDLFLEHFGIKSIDELPNAAELRAVKLPQPESEAPEAEGAEQPELLPEGAEEPESATADDSKDDDSEDDDSEDDDSEDDDSKDDDSKDDDSEDDDSEDDDSEDDDSEDGDSEDGDKD